MNLLEGVFLYDIDDLQGIADEALRQRQEEIARCERIIRDRVRGLLSPPPVPVVETAPAPASASPAGPAPV